MKKLITARIVEEFAASHETAFFIDDNTLVTPSAKDRARELHIAFVNECEKAGAGSKGQTCEAPVPCCPEEAQAPQTASEAPFAADVQLVVKTIMEVLRELGILERLIEK